MTQADLAPFPKIIAHRGASAEAPENTIAAFRRAGELGARAVEMDVSVSADGVAVIMHDPNVERCSNGTGAVVSKTLAELQALDGGSWFAPAFKGERIPTLKQAVGEVRAQGMALNLEIKPTPGFEEKTVDATVAVLKTVQLDELKLLVSSMNTTALSMFHEQMGDVALGLISDGVPENCIEVLNQLSCDSLHCPHPQITHEVVSMLHGAAKHVRTFTVNDVSAAKDFFTMGVDGIFTDHLDRMATLGMD